MSAPDWMHAEVELEVEMRRRTIDCSRDQPEGKHQQTATRTPEERDASLARMLRASC